MEFWMHYGGLPVQRAEPFLDDDGRDAVPHWLVEKIGLGWTGSGKKCGPLAPLLAIEGGALTLTAKQGGEVATQ